MSGKRTPEEEAAYRRAYRERQKATQPAQDAPGAPPADFGEQFIADGGLPKSLTPSTSRKVRVDPGSHRVIVQPRGRLLRDTPIPTKPRELGPDRPHYFDGWIESLTPGHRDYVYGRLSLHLAPKRDYGR